MFCEANMKRTINKLRYYISNGELFHHLLWIWKRKRIIKRKDKYSNREYLNKLYLNTFGVKPNLENPITYNEKLLWLKLFWRNNVCYSVVDKYKVRDYVFKQGCGENLVKLYGVFNSIDEIDFGVLPKSFVVKTTHDSGGIFVCRDKSNVKALRKGLEKINKHQRRNHSNTFLEWVYDKSEPKIIVEELIETDDGQPPKDYKFFCFFGEPKYFFVCSDRINNCKFDFFDLDGRWLNIKNGHPNSSGKIELPANLNEMIRIARLLSRDFPQVRVDLYSVHNKVYFGELTFFHHAGDERFKPNSFDKELGSCLDLSKIKKEEIIK